MLRIRLLPHNVPDEEVDVFFSQARRFYLYIHQYRDHCDCAAAWWALLEQAHQHYGFRSLALEAIGLRVREGQSLALQRGWALARFLILVLEEDAEPPALAAAYSDLGLEPAAASAMLWTIKTAEWGAGHPRDTLYWTGWRMAPQRPSFQVHVEIAAPAVQAPIPAEPALAVVEEELPLLPTQQSAVDRLHRLHALRRSGGLRVASLSPALTALVIGASGSGKSHAVRSFASQAGLHLHQVSAASWMPASGRGTSTLAGLARTVAMHDRVVVFLDEIDKLAHVLGRDGGYGHYLLVEIMALLDGQLATHEGWTPELEGRFRAGGMVVAAGAFQWIYNAAAPAHGLLGGDSTNLSIVGDEFLEECGLPTELVARLSPAVTEILPPPREAVAERVRAIHLHYGLGIDAATIDAVTRTLLGSRTGLRALECYALQCHLEPPSAAPSGPA